MLLSKLVCERTKEAPQDAKIKSHVLLSRAGFIKQVAVGIYSMTMPCQKMSVKIQKIIREEMDALDGQEVTVDGTKGCVYRGLLPLHDVGGEMDLAALPPTKTHVGLVLADVNQVH